MGWTWLKFLASHAGNRGSIPLGATSKATKSRDIKSLDEKAQNMEEVSINIGTSFELTY